MVVPIFKDIELPDALESISLIANLWGLFLITEIDWVTSAEFNLILPLPVDT